MNIKIYLISGILTAVVFLALLIDILTNSRNFSQVKFKEIIYLIGWLLLSITCLFEYYKKK